MKRIIVFLPVFLQLFCGLKMFKITLGKGLKLSFWCGRLGKKYRHFSMASIELGSFSLINQNKNMINMKGNRDSSLRGTTNCFPVVYPRPVAEILYLHNGDNRHTSL